MRLRHKFVNQSSRFVYIRTCIIRWIILHLSNILNYLDDSFMCFWWQWNVYILTIILYSYNFHDCAILYDALVKWGLSVICGQCISVSVCLFVQIESKLRTYTVVHGSWNNMISLWRYMLILAIMSFYSLMPLVLVMFYIRSLFENRYAIIDLLCHYLFTMQISVHYAIM